MPEDMDHRMGSRSSVRLQVVRRICIRIWHCPSSGLGSGKIDSSIASYYQLNGNRYEGYFIGTL